MLYASTFTSENTIRNVQEDYEKMEFNGNASATGLHWC